MPPALKPNTLRVIPLGGLGDVGRNMAVLEIDGQLLLIDCGVLFPEDHHPGVDLILPGFDAIDDRLDDVVALVLTHGHEDHIGAVPYLLKQRPDIQLIGSKLTLALLAEKIREHRIRGTNSRIVTDNERITIGNFDLEFVAVNHSIADALAVAVRTKAGTVLHTGDFKMDQLPLDGRITNLRAFARLGEEGVDLFMVDSTNAEVPGFTTPERDISPALERVFSTSTQRVVVACFASHVHRVQQVLNAAVAHGRKVVYVGRSMLRNMGVARDLGYLKNVMPVHGEIRHLLANADLAVATGVPRKRAIIAEDGTAVDLKDGQAHVVGKVDCGYIFVDGSTVGDISELSLTDRRILGEEGFISVIAVVNTRSGKIVSGPDIHARGFVEDDAAFDKVIPQITDVLQSAPDEGIDDTHRLQQVIRRRLGKWVNDTYRRRPMIIPVVIEA